MKSSIIRQCLLLATNQNFFFCQGSSLASVVSLLMLPCVCRLTVELEANRPDGPKVAGSPANKSSPVNDRSPATESQPDLLRSQPGLQAPHVQARPQVQSQSCALLSSLNAFVFRLQGSTCAS